MAEALTPLQQTERRIKDGLKFIFKNYQIKPSDILCYFDCLTNQEKTVIATMEHEDKTVTQAICELLDRLLEKPYWVDSFVTGIKQINNYINYPNSLYEDINKLFGAITIGVVPQLLIGNTRQEQDRLTAANQNRELKPVKSQTEKRKELKPVKSQTEKRKVVDCPNCIFPSTVDLEPKSETTRIIKRKYSTFKQELMAKDAILDKLEQENILGSYDIEDIKEIKNRRAWIDKLLKLIIRGGENICQKFLQIISSKYCESQSHLFKNNNIQNTDRFSVTTPDTEEIKSFLGRQNIEELMDLLVETDAFSLQDHDDVLEAKTREKQQSVLTEKIKSDKRKEDTFFKTVSGIYEKEKGYSTTNELSDSIDGSELEMEVDSDETRFDIRISIIPDTREVWTTELITSEIIEQLADDFKNKLTISGTSKGSVIIELEAKSADSLKYLRQAYLDGTIAKIIRKILDLTGIQKLVVGEIFVDVQIGFTKNREFRKSQQQSEHVQILNHKQYFLMEELDPYPILEAMQRQGLLTESQINWILTKKPCGRKSAVKELINMLKLMKQENFDQFLTILREGSQSYIFEHMTKQQDQVLLRKVIKDKLDEISEEMNVETIRNLFWDLKRISDYEEGLPRVFTTEFIKSFIQNFIDDNAGEKVYILVDALYASGLGHLLAEDVKEKFEKREAVAKMFDAMFQKSLSDKIIKVKEGSMTFTLNLENIHEIGRIVEYCDSERFKQDMEKRILGEGEHRIKELSDKFGVSSEEIGLSVVVGQSDLDVAVSWLNKTEGLTSPSKNVRSKKLTETYKRLLKDPLLTSDDVAEFLESKEKMLWIKSYAANKVERFDEKTLRDITQIVNRIYKECLAENQIMFDVDNDAEGSLVMYTKVDPEKREILHNVTLGFLIHENVISRISDIENHYLFKSELLLDFLVTEQDDFSFDSLHIELFPYCIVFKSADFLTFLMEQKDIPDVLRELMHEVIWMHALDQSYISSEILNSLFKDGRFNVPGQLVSIETKTVMNLLIEKALLRQILMKTDGYLCLEEGAHCISDDTITFEVYRNKPVSGKFVLSKAHLTYGLKICQIVSSIGGGQVVIELNNTDEVRFLVTLGSFRKEQCKFDHFSLEISNKTKKQLDTTIVGHIPQALSVMENLTVFKMMDTGLCYENMNNIIDSLVKTSLLHLCLNGNDLSEINRSGFKYFPRLEVLEMNGCKLSDGTISKLVAELTQLYSLEVIDVGNNSISAIGIAEMSKHLGELRYLKALRLQKNNLGEDAVHHLAKFLCKLPSIEIINLSGCKLGSRHIEELSKVLAEKCIRKINLRGNNISQKESAVLLQCLAEKSRYLQYLDYSQNEIGVSQKENMNLPTQSDTSLPKPATAISLPPKVDTPLPPESVASLQPLVMIGQSLQSIGDSAKELTPLYQETKQMQTTGESSFLHSSSTDAEASLRYLLETNSSCINYLCLWKCGLGYTKLFANITDNKFLNNLTSLCLQGNDLNDEFAESVGICMITSWHYLQHLNLNDNSISDKGVVALLEGLKHNVELEELYLERNKVKIESTVLEVFKSVTTSEHKKMNELNISHNAIPVNIREFLNQKMIRKCDIMSVRYEDDGKVTCMKRNELQVKF